MKSPRETLCLQAFVGLLVAILCGVTSAANASTGSGSALGPFPWPIEVPASYDYCEAPMPSLDLYQDTDAFSLKQVQIVNRHGDRSPWVVLPHENVEWSCGEIENTVAIDGNTSGREVESGVYFQKQSYLPQDSFYFRSLWSGDCAVGQLRAKGGSQLYQLGVQLRSIYVDRLNFVPSNLSSGNVDDVLYTRSTDFERTRQSLQNILRGFSPFDSFRDNLALSLVTYPDSVETMVPNRGSCPYIPTAYDKMTEQAAWQDALKNSNLSFLSQKLNVDHRKEFIVSSDAMFDVVMSRQCNQLPRPCGVSSTGSQTCVTDDEARRVQMQAHWETLYRFKYFLNDTVPRLYVGYFLAELASSLATAANASTLSINDTHMPLASTRAPMQFYLGHDVTLSSVLGALQADDIDMLWPPYRSNLIFELWESKSNGTNYLRVIYNGKQLSLPMCKEQTSMGHLCLFNDYHAFIQQRVPVDAVQACDARLLSSHAGALRQPALWGGLLTLFWSIFSFY